MTTTTRQAVAWFGAGVMTATVVPQFFAEFFGAGTVSPIVRSVLLLGVTVVVTRASFWKPKTHDEKVGVFLHRLGDEFERGAKK